MSTFISLLRYSSSNASKEGYDFWFQSFSGASRLLRMAVHGPSQLYEGSVCQSVLVMLSSDVTILQSLPDFRLIYLFSAHCFSTLISAVALCSI
ncbi:hypothetical protein TNIN_236921 [Trichonephila inaurata madagascariensis]|uniref:Uncharacterized protein n=1 Tax=Trichonephila inaurata madagascariensis TaxID=2747483 RepID=A0A8X7CAK3_9ARAC|nr:hypothetical protein TNIN_236921 [Trichonephila inaurata madagascariensis]